MSDRIVGGNETRITEFPWMVLIEYTKRKCPPCHAVLIFIINSFSDLIRFQHKAKKVSTVVEF